MNVADKELLRAKGIPVPQYYNVETGNFEVITGRDGANAFIEKGQVTVDSFGGSADVTKTYETKKFGVAVINLGTSDLTFTVNDITIPVYPGTAFSSLFEGFTKITINATSSFDCVIKE